MTDPPQFPGAPDFGENFADPDGGDSWRQRWRRIVEPFTFLLGRPRRAAQLVGLFLVVALVGFVFIDRGIVKRFEQRRSALPSRTYSMPFELKLRDAIEASELIDRLTVLGYRQVNVEPSKPGEFRQRRDIWTVFLRPGAMISQEREGRLVELRFRWSRLRRITDIRTRTSRRSVSRRRHYSRW